MAEGKSDQAHPPVSFQTHPESYQQWRLEVDGEVANLILDIQEDAGLRPGYPLKLNSYDLGVDIELADAIQRVRFEHPAVRVLVMRSGKREIFCSGANIYMLGLSSHAWKVNFCKFTNETRCGLEDASAGSGIHSIAALSGTASGGGYELALACDEIHLIDDGNSAVSLPEVPLLGVLPGTGGLTRLVDKRKVRRDRADVFSTVAEGLKGRRAKDWGLVDAVHPRSKFDDRVAARIEEFLAASAPKPAEEPVLLPEIPVEVEGDVRRYESLTVAMDRPARTATLTIRVPDVIEYERSAAFWPFAVFRQLDDALLDLRVNEHEIGTVIVRAEGSIDAALSADAILEERQDEWFVREVRLFIARTLRRFDLTAKSFYALVDVGSCFVGTLFELALASDRIYMLDDPDQPTWLAVTAQNGGAYPMSHGQSRLATRFLGEPERVPAALARAGEKLAPGDADDVGLVTFVFDDLDWEDEIRIAVEERASLSPDALTGMEANLRFAGNENCDSKIYGRLTAWQNWIFIRPNATGERGALTMYGKPERPVLDYKRV